MQRKNGLGKKIEGFFAMIDWVQTYSGKRFDFLDPKPEQIDIEDIAHSLSGLPRYNNHTKVPYSVAQHSLAVMRKVPVNDYLVALLHDAPEAYIGDMLGPIKRRVPQFQEIETGVWFAICRKFGLDGIIPESVRRADIIALATEQRDLMNECEHDWSLPEWAKPDIYPIQVMPFKEVKRKFLYTFKVLMERR